MKNIRLIERRRENRQLVAKGVDWLYCALGTGIYVALILLTIWWMP